ncbi:uncharacterized protein CLUP02_02505 [Colletotrichum lupini]|uniref:3-hydroxyisobutyrate dehydrogenase n=1 Tax=Colletotrichum lupini TaxID=145971 RepID=A0A9Q8SGV2_9PEZI|nr:uncharacterized protein CLUP02_02505 [Colletotrichum lupini]UQC77039.1 hypothetical protein CLUP02_02505 [Colletotrichum lupini]
MDFNIGFIGLGAIGYPMAASIRRNLKRQSTVHVFDVNKSACEKFVQQFSSFGQVEVAASPREVAAAVDVVISMVPGAPEVSKVYLDVGDGIISAPKNPQRLYERLLKGHMLMPLFPTFEPSMATTLSDSNLPQGGVPAAEKATLSFMIGRKPDDKEDHLSQRLRQVVSMMGDPEKLFWCGDVGSGLAAKISNNYISCSILLLISEAMAIGVKSGVDPKMLQKIIHNSTGQTFMGDNMFLKDLSLGIDAAKQENIQPTMAEAAYGVFEKASKDPRCIDRDGSSVYLYVTDSKT